MTFQSSTVVISNDVAGGIAPLYFGVYTGLMVWRDLTGQRHGKRLGLSKGCLRDVIINGVWVPCATIVFARIQEMVYFKSSHLVKGISFCTTNSVLKVFFLHKAVYLFQNRNQNSKQ